MTAAGAARVAYLDGRRFRRILLAGCSRLADERAWLDRINVFPVPDGDTGTNLALTVATVGERVRASATRHAGELLSLAAEAALDGARGNSGAIFAQYLQGLVEALSGCARVRPAQLALALASAERNARSALQDPVDGTVLTVMRDMAEAVAPGRLPADADFADFHAALLAQARDSAAATRFTLASVRSAGVEDAGARAMVILLEGMADALMPGVATPAGGTPADDSEAVGTDHAADLAARHAGPPEHRFCTECLVTGASVDRDALRASLAEVGSSVVVVGSPRKVRLHVHVNHPGEAFAIARRYGSVSAEKADDMRRQEIALRLDGRRVAVVTDSGADLPEEIWDDLGIHMVPLRVNFGDASHLDKVGLTAEGFWAELASSKVHPKTSQPPVSDFSRAFELLSSHFEQVVSIHLTGRLSGTCQAATAAAGRTSRSGQLTVIDSRNLSVGLGLIVLCAAEKARTGATGPEVLAAIENAIARTRTYGAIPDLDFAVRGGRIPQRWQWVARRLPLGFLMATDVQGGVRVRGVLRRGGNRVAALLGVAVRDYPRNARLRIAIGHSNARGLAADLRQACQATWQNIDTLHVTDLGPTYGVHGGPGALALAIQEQVAS